MNQHSIADEPPDDVSGRLSRGGYGYQDLCALRYCVHAAHTGVWDEVWCESHDDIVLYKIDNVERYRFVQSKYRFASDNHWSVVQLCEHERNRTVEDSIICKLFLKDKFAGISDFRLVTNEGTNSELQPFHYRWKRIEPTIDANCTGVHNLLGRLKDWTPPANKSITEYLARFADNATFFL